MRCRTCLGAVQLPLAGKLSWLMEEQQIQTTPEIWRVVSSLLLGASVEVESTPRVYYRYNIKLLARYTPADGTTVTAEVINISRGGIALLTATPVAVATSIEVQVTSDARDVIKIDFRGIVEITRCRDLRNGNYEVGGKFLDAAPNAFANRSLCTIWYQRREWKQPRRGDLTDFNHHGLAFIANAAMLVNEVFFIDIRSDAGVFKETEMRGLARVMACKMIYGEHYEINAEFVGTRTLSSRTSRRASAKIRRSL
jgi:hypothetical protein